MPLQTDPGMIFESGKVYAHSVGLSCTFRQWRAESHCKYLHGYSIKVEIDFRATTLDARNWVVDFGSLKSFKGWLEDTFDHKTLVAEDDPAMVMFRRMELEGLIQLRVLPAVGCEAMSYAIYQYLDMWLDSNGYSKMGVVAQRVKVSEHESNWAAYSRGTL